MGILKFIAKNASLGPAVKVWVDAYYIFFERTDVGLVNKEKAELYFNHIKRMNILANRPDDYTKNISFNFIESYLLKLDDIEYEPIEDLPSFLAIMMFYEIKLIREAFIDHPKTAISFLEIIYEIVYKNAPNSVVSKKNDFIKFSNYRIKYVCSIQRFID